MFFAGRNYDGAHLPVQMEFPAKLRGVPQLIPLLLLNGCLRAVHLKLTRFRHSGL
jgi:hypothetical protein